MKSRLLLLFIFAQVNARSQSEIAAIKYLVYQVSPKFEEIQGEVLRVEDGHPIYKANFSLGNEFQSEISYSSDSNHRNYVSTLNFIPLKTAKKLVEKWKNMISQSITGELQIEPITYTHAEFVAIGYLIKTIQADIFVTYTKAERYHTAFVNIIIERLR